MSKSERHAPNVGVGSLQRPDDEYYSINEGWDMFPKHVPDDSVIDSFDFQINPNSMAGNGPYIFYIPQYKNQYADFSTFRLKGTAQIKYKDNGVWTTLPKDTEKIANPFGSKSFEIEEVDIPVADKDKNAHEIWTTHNIIKSPDYDNTAPKGFKFKTVNSYYEPNTIANISPCQFLIQAMWKDIEIKINGQIITKNANLEYAYKQYIEKLLTYSKDAMTTHQSAECYVPDEFIHDDPNTFSGENIKNWPAAYAKSKTFHKRRARFCNDKPFSFSMALHTELNSISAFMMDDIAYEFSFIRNSPEFYLNTGNPNTTGQYTVEFSDLRLCGRFMKPTIQIERKLL